MRGMRLLNNRCDVFTFSACRKTGSEHRTIELKSAKGFCQTLLAMKLEPYTVIACWITQPGKKVERVL